MIRLRKLTSRVNYYMDQRQSGISQKGGYHLCVPCRWHIVVRLNEEFSLLVTFRLVQLNCNRAAG